MIKIVIFAMAMAISVTVLIPVMAENIAQTDAEISTDTTKNLVRGRSKYKVKQSGNEKIRRGCG